MIRTILEVLQKVSSFEKSGLEIFSLESKPSEQANTKALSFNLNDENLFSHQFSKFFSAFLGMKNFQKI